MFDFITQIIFVLSLGIIAYLFARALPRVVEDPGAVPTTAFDKLVDRLPLDEVDEVLVSTFEKILRKARVFVLKFDNRINHYLDQLRKHSPAVREKQGVELKEKIDAMAEVVSENKQK
jgi:hypothetical protein